MYDLQQIAVAVHEYTMFPTKQERSAYLRRRVGGQVSIYRTKLSSRFGRGAQQPSRSAERGGAPEASQKPADRLTRALYVCYLKYRAQKIDVPVTQLWTQESRAQVTGDLTLGWAQAFDGEFQAVGVPGGHRTMFDDENTAAVPGTRVLNLGVPEPRHGIRMTGEGVVFRDLHDRRFVDRLVCIGIVTENHIRFEFDMRLRLRERVDHGDGGRCRAEDRDRLGDRVPKCKNEVVDSESKGACAKTERTLVAGFEENGPRFEQAGAGQLIRNGKVVFQIVAREESDVGRVILPQSDSLSARDDRRWIRVESGNGAAKQNNRYGEENEKSHVIS